MNSPHPLHARQYETTWQSWKQTPAHPKQNTIMVNINKTEYSFVQDSYKSNLTTAFGARWERQIGTGVWSAWTAGWVVVTGKFVFAVGTGRVVFAVGTELVVWSSRVGVVVCVAIVRSPPPPEGWERDGWPWLIWSTWHRQVPPSLVCTVYDVGPVRSVTVAGIQVWCEASR